MATAHSPVKARDSEDGFVLVKMSCKEIQAGSPHSVRASHLENMLMEGRASIVEAYNSNDSRIMMNGHANHAYNNEDESDHTSCGQSSTLTSVPSSTSESCVIEIEDIDTAQTHLKSN